MRYGKVNRDERITVRFTPEEIETLERARGDSRQLGMFGRSRNLSRFVRRCALAHVEQLLQEKARQTTPASDKSAGDRRQTK